MPARWLLRPRWPGWRWSGPPPRRRPPTCCSARWRWTRCDAVFVLQGFQPDPLTAALAARWGERADTLALPRRRDRAATCACSPLWTPRTKRTRGRLRAGPHRGRPRARGPGRHRPRADPPRARMLGARGVAIRDENGWKLSTTRVAAELMALLRALAWNASSDDVLDALKSAPAWGASPAARRWSPGCAARACATGAMSSACAAPTAWMPKPLRWRRWWPRWLPPAPASARPGRWPPGSTSCATCC